MSSKKKGSAKTVEAEPTKAPKKEKPPAWESEIRIQRQHLSAFVQTLSALVTEAVVRRDGDELVSKVVDPSHVAMAVSRIRTAAGVDSFPEDGELAFDLEKMRENVRPFDALEVIQLRFGSRKPHDLIIQADGTTMEQSRIDPAGITDPKVPNVTPPWSGYVRAWDLLTSLREAGKISDHIQFRSPKEGETGLRVLAEGETAKWERTIPAENITGEFKGSLYPLDFLTAIITAIVEANGPRSTITVESGNEYPLKIGADMPFGESIFLLAPRVEED